MTKKLTDENSTTVGVMPIKLGSCVTEPTSKLHDDLMRVALECNRARTAMVRAFQRWHEDNPGWSPPVIKDKTGKPYSWRGHPMLENQPLPLAPRVAGAECQADSSWKTKSKDDQRGLSKWLCPQCGKHLSRSKECPTGCGPVEDPGSLFYRVGCQTAPSIATKLISACVAEVQSHLKSRMPPAHRGMAQYRWQAILHYEVAATSFRNITVPTPCQDTVLIHDGFAACQAPVSGSMAAKLKIKSGGALIKLPLFSGQSGRQRTYEVCRIVIGALTHGQHRIIARVAQGKWKLSDSRLVFDEDESTRKGNWSWQMTYQQPLQALGLNRDRVAVLKSTGKDDSNPFTIALDTTEEFRPWKLGQARTITESYKRLARRRRLIREGYRMQGSSGIKGHGRSRVFRSLSLPTRKSRNLAKSFVKKLLSEVMRFCLRYDCGTICYHEPGLFMRDKAWFAANDVPFDWTVFRNDLEAQCRRAGVTLVNDNNVPLVERRGKKKAATG